MNDGKSVQWGGEVGVGLNWNKNFSKNSKCTATKKLRQIMKLSKIN